MGYGLNSLKGFGGLYRGLLLGVFKGDTRSLDNGSYRVLGVIGLRDHRVVGLRFTD